MEENNVHLSDGHSDDHSDENSESNASLDPATNNGKPSASFSETLYKETGIRKDKLDDLGKQNKCKTLAKARWKMAHGNDLAKK